jgi:hypothetical protein
LPTDIIEHSPLCGRKLTSTSELPQPHAGSAAVLSGELDAAQPLESARKASFAAEARGAIDRRWHRTVSALNTE